MMHEHCGSNLGLAGMVFILGASGCYLADAKHPSNHKFEREKTAEVRYGVEPRINVVRSNGALDITAVDTSLCRTAGYGTVTLIDTAYTEKLNVFTVLAPVGILASAVLPLYLGVRERTSTTEWALGLSGSVVMGSLSITQLLLPRYGTRQSTRKVPGAKWQDGPKPCEPAQRSQGTVVIMARDKKRSVEWTVPLDAQGKARFGEDHVRAIEAWAAACERPVSVEASLAQDGKPRPSNEEWVLPGRRGPAGYKLGATEVGDQAGQPVDIRWRSVSNSVQIGPPTAPIVPIAEAVPRAVREFANACVVDREREAGEAAERKRKEAEEAAAVRVAEERRAAETRAKADRAFRKARPDAGDGGIYVWIGVTATTADGKTTKRSGLIEYLLGTDAGVIDGAAERNLKQAAKEAVQIDGAAPTAQLTVEIGPYDDVKEARDAFRASCGADCQLDTANPEGIMLAPTDKLSTAIETARTTPVPSPERLKLLEICKCVGGVGPTREGMMPICLRQGPSDELVRRAISAPGPEKEFEVLDQLVKETCRDVPGGDAGALARLDAISEAHSATWERAIQAEREKIEFQRRSRAEYDSMIAQKTLDRQKAVEQEAQDARERRARMCSCNRQRLPDGSCPNGSEPRNWKVICSQRGKDRPICTCPQ
jgi:hypothetical protein